MERMESAGDPRIFLRFCACNRADRRENSELVMYHQKRGWRLPAAFDRKNRASSLFSVILPKYIFSIILRRKPDGLWSTNDNEIRRPVEEVSQTQGQGKAHNFKGLCNNNPNSRYT